MPIKGLTDRAARLPRIGIIRKGAAKPERGPGRDQKFFRLQTEDPDLAMAWESAFGAEPTQFEVYLAYDDPDESFETCREEWVSGGLKHRCDGETCSIHLLPDGKSYSLASVPCPHLKTTFDDLKKRPCQPIGKLRVLVPEMRRIGVFECQTHSINDIVSLSSNIALYALLARQAGRPLSGIPFVLSRREREISTPGDGKRVRRKVSLLNLDISTKWAQFQFDKRSADLVIGQSTKVLELPADTPEETSDPDDDSLLDAAPDQYVHKPTAPIASKRETQVVVKTPARTNAREPEVASATKYSDVATQEAAGMDPLDLPAGTKRKDQGSRPNLEKRWNDLALALPYEAREMYFIPEVLPRTWTMDDVTEAGKALGAFTAAWKRQARVEELEAICEVIVAIRALDGEIPKAEESPIPF